MENKFYVNLEKFKILSFRLTVSVKYLFDIDVERGIKEVS